MSDLLIYSSLEILIFMSIYSDITKAPSILKNTKMSIENLVEFVESVCDI